MSSSCRATSRSSTAARVLCRRRSSSRLPASASSQAAARPRRPGGRPSRPMPRSRRGTDDAEAEADASARERGPAPASPQGARGDRRQRAAVSNKRTRPPSPSQTPRSSPRCAPSRSSSRDPAAKKILTEADGIGTPATRAAIIETLFERGYVERAKQGHRLDRDRTRPRPKPSRGRDDARHDRRLGGGHARHRRGPADLGRVSRRASGPSSSSSSPKDAPSAASPSRRPRAPHRAARRRRQAAAGFSLLIPNATAEGRTRHDQNLCASAPDRTASRPAHARTLCRFARRVRAPRTEPASPYGDIAQRRSHLVRGLRRAALRGGADLALAAGRAAIALDQEALRRPRAPSSQHPAADAPRSARRPRRPRRASTSCCARSGRRSSRSRVCRSCKASTAWKPRWPRRPQPSGAAGRHPDEGRRPGARQVSLPYTLAR